MIDADIIIPTTTANRFTFLLAQVAIRTCHASTKGRIFVMDNNGCGSPYSKELQDECKLLGVCYQYFHEKFSTSKFFNKGHDLTTGQYVAFGSSDLIFYPNWLENIIELWESDPSWFCLAPFQFGSAGMSCGRHDLTLENRIVRTHNVACGIAVFKRENGYRWDESYPYQCDADFVYEAEANSWKLGYCLNSRVDHLAGSQIRTNTDQTAHNERPRLDNEADMLREKWGNRYKGA